MHPRRKPLIACALAVATLGVAAAVVGTQATAPARPTADSLSPDARTTLAICHEHVAMEHDVKWAAACIGHARGHEDRRAECLRQRGAKSESECAVLLGPADDSPDCMLPNDRAARLNAALSIAENRCVEQATAENGPVRPARFSWLRH